MDLTDILRKRTKADLAVAIARSLELSLEIESVAKELKSLREASGRIGKGNERSGAGSVAMPQPAASDHSGKVAQASGKQTSGKNAKKALHRKILRKFTSRHAEPPRFHWHFDEIAGAFPARDKSGVHAVISTTSFPAVTMSGWVVPMGNDPAFKMVEIALTGERDRIVRETQTYQRPDVAAHFGNPAVSSCGFRLEIPMFEIGSGQYTVRITCRTPEGIVASLVAGTVTIP